MSKQHLHKKTNAQYKYAHQLSQPVQTKHQSSLNDSTHNEFIDIDNAEKVKVYFEEIMSRNEKKNSVLNNAGSEDLRGGVEKNVSLAIKKGEIQLSGKRGEIQKIINESKIKQASAQSEQKRKEERDMRKFNIDVLAGKKQLALNNVNEEQQLKLIHSRTSVLTKKQHQLFLDKITREKSELSLKKKSTNQRERIKLEEQQKRKNTLFEEELQRAKQEKKRKAIERLQEQKAKHQQKMKQEEQNNKKVNQIREKKFLHEKLQEKYNAEIVIPSLEERKKKLKEIRNQSKAFTMQQVNKFEKEYMKKKQVHHDNQTKGNEQWTYKAPQKPKKLSQMLEEQNNQSKLKLEEKKKRLQDKIKRQSQFLAHLKVINPTVPLKANKKQQNLNLSKIQEKPVPDIKSIGKSYQQEAKKRKRSVIPQTQQTKDQPSFINDDSSTKKTQTNYLTSNKSEQEYSRIRDQRISKIIESSETDNTSKIIQLRTQAERLEQEQKRIELKQKINKNLNLEDDDKSTRLLLASIKAKMGIIDLYNKN